MHPEQCVETHAEVVRVALKWCSAAGLERDRYRRNMTNAVNRWPFLSEATGVFDLSSGASKEIRRSMDDREICCKYSEHLCL